MTLEQVVREIEGKPFFEVREGIQQHLDELIEACKTTKSQQEKVFSDEFSDEDRMILGYSYYLAIQWYSSAGHRKLGGPYFLHPHEAFTIALKAGVVDIPTLTSVLYHDIIEELIETSKKREYARQQTRKTCERKRSSLRREKKLITKYLDELQDAYYEGLITIGIELSKANNISKDTKEILKLLTRLSTEIYYKSISNIFTPRYNVENKVNIERAISAKFCDRIANTNDLERANVASQRDDCILYNNIISAFENNNPNLMKEIEDVTKKKARRQHVSEREFSGQQRLYQCFKNIVLINRYRERKIIEKSPVPAVAHLYLADATLRETRIILNHLCTYHCADDILNPQKVYDIHKQCKEYAGLGGFFHATKPVKTDGAHIGFDGILEHFFDARVRGDEHPLEEVYKDRSLMFKLALALNYIARYYVEQHDYILQGLTQNGLKTRPPIDKRYRK